MYISVNSQHCDILLYESPLLLFGVSFFVNWNCIKRHQVFFFFFFFLLLVIFIVNCQYSSIFFPYNYVRFQFDSIS